MSSSMLSPLILLALLAGAPSYADAGPGRSTVAVVDDMGREVVVPYPAERLITLGTAGAEIVWALGAGAGIVGRSQWAAFPPALAERPSVGDVSCPNLEILLGLNPDVVIADSHFSASAPRMEALGIPVVFIDCYRPDQVAYGIDRIGRLLGREDRAKRLSAFIERYMGLLSLRVGKVRPGDRPRVFRSFGYDTFITASDKGGGLPLLELSGAGGSNIAARLAAPFPQVDPEWVVKEGPDCLVVDADLKGVGFRVADAPYMALLWQALACRPGIKGLACVRDGRAWVINTGITFGPRAMIGALYLAKRFHPGLFYDVDPAAVHRQMLEEFYGIELDGAYIYP